MPTRRINPNLIKLHRSYLTSELAARLDVHKNTVRNWQREGLQPIDSSRPLLFHGETIRAFLTKRNADRKCPCSPGMLYCVRCRASRRPALGKVDYLPINATSGNVRAICPTCQIEMHRRARRAALSTILPGCDVQIMQAPSRLSGSSHPSLNCDLERQEAK